jgi:DNA-binding ferritin-like protein
VSGGGAGDFDAVAELTVIEDAAEVPAVSEEMIRSLLIDSDKLANLFQLLFDLAEQQGEHGLSNFVADRQDAHRQHSWMLRSSLGG